MSALRLLGCRDHSTRTQPPEQPEQPEQPEPARPGPPFAAPSGSTGRAPGDLAVKSAVADVRGRLLSLAAPDRTPRKLAFGRGFLVQVQPTGVTLLNSSTGEELLRAPIQEPRLAVGLAAGSVLVPGLDASFRFDPHQRSMHRLKRLSLLPGSEILPSSQSLHRVWIVHAPLGQLLDYELNDDTLPGPRSETVLSDMDGRAFATLRDGRLLFSAKSGLSSFGPGSRLAKLELPGATGPVWRILPAYRLSQAWLVTPRGEFLLVEVASRVRVVRKIETGLAPFDVAALGKRIALVSVSPPGSPSRRFDVHVYDEEGKLLFSQQLPSSAVSADADWVRGVSADKQLALGETPPRLAVGGPSTVQVFDLGSGKKLFER